LTAVSWEAGFPFTSGRMCVPWNQLN